jgi:hypothetical protein
VTRRPDMTAVLGTLVDCAEQSRRPLRRIPVRIPATACWSTAGQADGSRSHYLYPLVL